jgi:hypothetical protein
MIDVSDRHPDTQRKYMHFSGEPVQEILRPVVWMYRNLAENLILGYPDGPDFQQALDLLLQSRDAMLRHTSVLFTARGWDARDVQEE